ncbi:hypothetical protein ACJJTC_013219 [Scirpophaga incertulas]
MYTHAHKHNVGPIEFSCSSAWERHPIPLYVGQGKLRRGAGGQWEAHLCSVSIDPSKAEEINATQPHQCLFIHDGTASRRHVFDIPRAKRAAPTLALGKSISARSAEPAGRQRHVNTA